MFRSGVSPSIFIGVAIFIAVFATPALAQNGGLRVAVHDGGNGERLPGATVMLSSDQGLIAPTAQLSDAEGIADFPVLRAGRGYIVEVSFPGFATRRVPALRVASGDRNEVLVSLSPSIDERIEVVGTTRLVDVDRSDQRSRFTDEFIQSLPVPGRFYQETLTLAPGVNDSDGDGNPNVHGARSRDFKAVVSGVSNVDPLTGQWLSYVNPESIEVMDVITAGAGAEFGRAQGGFARIVQKQGTNRFEGVFNFLYRSSKVDGDGATHGTPKDLVPDFKWLQPSIQISGPIVKDKLWFRLSHEWIDRTDPVNTLTSIVPTETEQKLIADQITWQVSPRNKLAFQYQYDPLTRTGLGLSSTVPLESTTTIERGGPTYALAWTAPQSPRLLAEAGIAYQDHFQDIVPTDPGASQDCVSFGFFTFPILNDSYCRESILGRTSGGFPDAARDKRQRLTVQGKVTWFAGDWLGATHKVQTGFISENERYFRELERGPEIIGIEPIVALTPPDNPFCSSCPIAKGLITVRVPVPRNTSGSADGTSWGFFIEDQIKPAENLAITLGLRWDREEINAAGRGTFDPAREAERFAELIANGALVSSAIREAFTSFPDVPDFQEELATVLNASDGQIALSPIAIQSTFWSHPQKLEDIDIANDNIAPRISAAWDPWADGKAKISFSAGRYFDKIFLAVPLIEIEPRTTDLTFDANGSWNGQAGVFAERFTAQRMLPSLGATISSQQVARDLKTPYQDEYSLGLEYELWPETALKLTWLRRKFREQLQDVDVNHELRDLGFCIRANQLGDLVVAPSPGSGFLIVDRYSGEIYEDTDPGPGDGRLDDCTGILDVRGQGFFGPPFINVPIPDGLPDVYALNPAWGDVLVTGNFNRTDYRGLILELIRRLHRNWEMQGSYTWSEASGNAEDFNQSLGNESNLIDQEAGFLSYDQRHVFQLTGVALVPGWGMRFGGRLRWESGTPYSILEPQLAITGTSPELLNLARSANARFRLRFPTGQRNDQRNPSFWTVDVKLVKEFQIKTVNVQLTGEIFNLLNEDTIRLESTSLGVNTGTREFGRRFQFGLRVGF